MHAEPHRTTKAEWLTTAEAARLLRTSSWTVRRLARSGRLPAYRWIDHGPLRFRIEDVEALLQPLPVGGVSRGTG